MKSPLLHPVLFAFFPILFLYSRNAKSLSLDNIIIPLAIMLLVSVILFLIALAVFKNKKRAAAMVSLSMILLFSFGHAADMLAKYGIAVLRMTPNKITALVWMAIATAVFFFLLRQKKELNRTTEFLNTFAAILVLFQLVSISYFLVTRPATPKPVSINEVDLKKTDMLPDIYYISLDGYARDDILREVYNFDNGEFLEFLKESGFFIAEKSSSNYCQTILSLVSSLNMNYLDEGGIDIDAGGDDRLAFADRLADNVVVSSLTKQLGYSSVSFASGYSLTDLENYDAHIVQRFDLNEYNRALLRLTPIPLLFGVIEPYKMHHDRIVFVTEKIPEITGVSSPKFVFAHILAPHPPFTFGENGELVRPKGRFDLDDGSHFFENGSTLDDYKEGYINNIISLNGMLKKMISKLLADSQRPLIIIVQSDHGPGSGLDWNSLENSNLRERFSIMNAYYFYDRDYSRLYPEITPVNSFRVILKQYFKAEHDLLDDRSYYSTWSKPYEFFDITERLKINTKSSPKKERAVFHKAL